MSSALRQPNHQRHPVLGIRIDPDLAQRIRVLAASRKTTISALVEEAIRKTMPPVRVVESKSR